MRIYVDNAGTSFPKPPEVTAAMVRFAQECGVAAGRGSFTEAKICHEIITNCRKRMAELIHAAEGDWMVFTMNCSESLNVVIRGLLRCAPAGTHAICTAMEHNSVLRPYHTMAKQNGLEFDIIDCDPVTGIVDPEDIRRAIRPKTRLISCIHASNVTGSIQPIAEVAAIAREHGIPCVVDASQSGGHVPIDVQKLGADFVAFPGHKGLLGPLGTGVLYLRAGAEKLLDTIKEGGTGTQSELLLQPENMPDRFEVGSQNGIGIAGLGEALAWLLKKGIDGIRRHDREMTDLFLKLTEGIKGLQLTGPRDSGLRVGVFCVNLPGFTPLELSQRLEKDYGLLTRAGLHCAPLAHKAVGTYPTGACRISFGVFNSEDHVRCAANALAAIAGAA